MLANSRIIRKSLEVVGSKFLTTNNMIDDGIGHIPELYTITSQSLEQVALLSARKLTPNTAKRGVEASLLEQNLTSESHIPSGRDATLRKFADTIAPIGRIGNRDLGKM